MAMHSHSINHLIPPPHPHSQAHAPCSEAMQHTLATIISRFTLRVATNRKPKVFAVDCDNTLWVGAVAELGPQVIILTKIIIFSYVIIITTSNCTSVFDIFVTIKMCDIGLLCHSQFTQGVKVNAGHKALQNFLLEKQRAGALLCICR